MNYRTLGRTGLRVSEIGLGTVELGLDYGMPIAGEHLRPSEEQAARLLNRALDLGVTFIDTARAYGASEEVIGRALKGRRHEYVLATKLAPIIEEGQSDRALADQVQASIAESLRMLQTDVIDLLQFHRTSVEVVKRGRVLAAARVAQQAGAVRFIGASTYGEEEPLAVLEDGGYDTLQVAYNLADRTLEAKVLPLAERLGVGVIVRSVLLRGVLTHRFVHIPEQLADLREAIGRLNDLVGGETASLPELAYRFVLGNPAVAVALVGTARLSELEEALAFVGAHDSMSRSSGQGGLTAALVAAIRQIEVADRRQLIPSNWPADAGI
jgi:aryl-alcohol dehydrogenase-like predicted oxidoreductase